MAGRLTFNQVRAGSIPVIGTLDSKLDIWFGILYNQYMAYKDPSDPRLLEKRREHYRNNKEAYSERARQREADMKKFVMEKKSVPCMDCGVRYSPWQMDFDHREPDKKVAGIPALIKGGSWQKLIDEINKCDVVCANCHRDRTAKMFGWSIDQMPSDALQ